MKIAYDAKRFFHNSSGLGNYSRDLIRLMAEQHPENQYLLLDKKASQRGGLLLENPSVQFVPVKGWAGRQLRAGKAAQEMNADIFHGLSGELPLQWTSKPIRKVVTQHDLIFLRYPRYYSFFDRHIHTAKFKNACAQADVVVAVSEATKQDLIQYLGVPEEKIQVIYQGCHPIFSALPLEEIQANHFPERNLPERFVLSVGTVEPRKNLYRSLCALQDTGIPLVVVGRHHKKYFNSIQNLVQKHQMTEQVIFLTDVNLEELARLYRRCEFVLYPSEFEGFGIPVLEALSSGKTVITSHTSALPEAGGRHAVYVNPISVEDIRAKILHLWNNPEEAKRRLIGVESHLEKFRDGAIAQQWHQLYSSLR